MNYLAHLSLAYPNPGLIAGNYIGDLIRHKEAASIHPLLTQGLMLHRWIDHFSNNSAPLIEINKSFHNLIHKYSPVASDIICDYLLYLSWEEHFDISFSEFSDYNYNTLHNYSQYMPERVAVICQKMIQHQWLNQYKSMEGIKNVLERTNLNTKFSVDLTLVLPTVQENKEAFIKLFNLFYIECKKQSIEWINLQNEMK